MQLQVKTSALLEGSHNQQYTSLFLIIHYVNMASVVICKNVTTLDK